MRGAFTALAILALQLGAIAPVGASPSSAETSRVEGVSELRVGDRLEATRDVSLDEAIVSQGSKVSVSGKRTANGGVLIDVALADGHVVKGIPLPEIAKNFRRVK
jgi:uncharacterized Zn-binding protein involved in type VI secretion